MTEIIKAIILLILLLAFFVFICFIVALIIFGKTAKSIDEMDKDFRKRV